MFAIIIWLISVIIGCAILYLIIRSAIDSSVLGEVSTELRTMSSSVKREQQEMRQQISELSELVREQNALIKSMRSNERGD